MSQQAFDAAAEELIRRRREIEESGRVVLPASGKSIWSKPALPEAQCSVCGAVFGSREGETRCGSFGCEEKHRLRVWAQLPKNQLLHKSRTPEEYRAPFDSAFHGRGKPAAKSWNGFGLDDWGSLEEWSGSPPWVTIVGRNGAGKSWLAAELLFRAAQVACGELHPLVWVRQDELIAEERETPLGQPRSLMHRARSAAGLVIDDFGWTSEGLEIMSRLAEVRSAGKKVTIWTSHRPWNSGQESIRVFCALVFDRMKAGLIVPIERASGRAAIMQKR